MGQTPAEQVRRMRQRRQWRRSERNGDDAWAEGRKKDVCRNFGDWQQHSTADPVILVVRQRSAGGSHHRGVAQPGSARRSGRRGRGFKSRHPDSESRFLSIGVGFLHSYTHVVLRLHLGVRDVWASLYRMYGRCGASPCRTQCWAHDIDAWAWSLATAGRQTVRHTCGGCPMRAQVEAVEKAVASPRVDFPNVARPARAGRSCVQIPPPRLGKPIPLCRSRLSVFGWRRNENSSDFTIRKRLSQRASFGGLAE